MDTYEQVKSAVAGSEKLQKCIERVSQEPTMDILDNLLRVTHSGIRDGFGLEIVDNLLVGLMAIGKRTEIASRLAQMN